MKRTVSVLLLMVFLFNVGGYYIVFWGISHQADRVLTAKLDAHLYSEEETIELKIPVTLPYPLQSREFERIDGKFEHQGQHYKLVKHKLEKDTLYVVCIRDYEQKKIASTLNDYTRMANDLPASKKAITFLSKLLKDFESTDKNTMIHQAGWCRDIQLHVKPFELLTSTARISSPPPEV
jgi:hypothetical protein